MFIAYLRNENDAQSEVQSELYIAYSCNIFSLLNAVALYLMISSVNNSFYNKESFK